MNIIFTLLAAAVLTAPKGSIYNNEQVVTDVDLSGLASAADLDAKRDKTDLAVYEMQDDVGGAYLPPEALPVVYGDEILETRIYFKVMSPEDQAPFDAAYFIADKTGPIGNFLTDGKWYGGWSGLTFGGRDPIPGQWPVLVIPKKIAPSADKLATTGEIGEVTGYARAVYNYMLGNTNAWFSGTNSPDKATAPNKHKFQFEPGMDLMSVPCSMALWEIRDGERGTVWDQRDWVSWYWNFKSAQMRSEIAATNEAIMAAMPRKAWGTYTARGLENPDPTTVWVDAQTITLSAGFAWQTVDTVSGCAYWTIVGNGAVIGNSGTNAVLEIRDFEGKAVMRMVKGENYLAYVDSSSMTGQGRDAQGRVTFDLTANAQPVGEYSTVLETSSFVEESSSGCPVDYEWENLGDGRWRIHFILKPGINSNACFARFKVAVQRDSTIEYTTAPTISGGLIYNGVKIAPVINGDTVTWRVVK